MATNVPAEIMQVAQHVAKADAGRLGVASACLTRELALNAVLASWQRGMLLFRCTQSAAALTTLAETLTTGKTFEADDNIRCAHLAPETSSLPSSSDNLPQGL